MDKEYRSKEELLKTAQSALHVPFGELDKTNRLTSKKGGVGQMVEENVFEYSVNSIAGADIPNLGVEIKTTPVIRKADGSLRSKERLVLNIINYMEEELDDFELSSFWKKNKDLLIMFYEHNYRLPKILWEFFSFIDYQWPEEDLLIVKNDWKIITNKIASGKAHEISEGDTMYLAACTKGATADSSLREQPFSTECAKQRAYSLKVSYMNYILNSYVLGNKESEKIIKSTEQLSSKSFEDIIKEMFNPYIGMTQSELMNIFDIKKSKSTNSSIINKILKINGDLSKTEEFLKANITPKTIRIEPNGTIKESMSFPSFSFIEILNQSWEESDFYEQITARFMFVVFKKTDDDDLNSILESVQFFSLPENDLKEAKRVFIKTQSTIKNGVILNPTSNGIKNNLPKISESNVSHVRPHTSKSYYKFGNYEKGDIGCGDQLPDGRWMTKQCFWLNAKYIESKLK